MCYYVWFLQIWSQMLSSWWLNYQNSIQLSVSNIRNFYNCQVLAWLCSKNLTKFLSNYHYLTDICTKFCCIILCSTRNMILLEKYTHKLLNSSVWNDHIMILQQSTMNHFPFYRFLVLFYALFFLYNSLMFTLILYFGKGSVVHIHINYSKPIPLCYLSDWGEIPKCHALKVKRATMYKILSSYYLHDTILEVVENCKHQLQGFTVWSGLRWSKHIQNITTKASRKC